MICASGVAGRSWSCRVVPIRKKLSLFFSNNDNYHRRCNIIQKLRSNFTVVSTTRVLTASMADHSAASDSKSVNALIKGTVQGVFYRKWTISAAQKLGLNGWVRNLKDGSVEAVFSGPSNAVDDMIQQCHSGPSNAKVTSVDVSKWDHEVPQGFEKRKSP